MRSTMRRFLAVLFALFTSGMCAYAATDLPLGQVTTGTISLAAQMDSYSFTGTAGEVVDLTMTPTSGTLAPKIQLLSPGGTLLGSACKSGPQELNTITLTSTGTYTVTASDCSGTNTGNYALFLQSINSPVSPITLPVAQVQTGAIGSAALDNTYTFSASANDVVDFTAVTTSGSMSPRIRLYSATGALLSDQANRYGDGVCSGGSVVELNTVTLTASGTYTVLVGDCSDTNTGAYNLYMQRPENPTGPINLPFGQVTTGTIGSAGLDNTYTFSANANDVVDFTAVATGGNLSPRIRLYSPTGVLLSDQANRYGDGVCSGGSVIELNTVALAVSGTYTALVGDCGDTNTGTYNLYLQRSENPSGAATLPFGQVTTGTIGFAGLDNTYTFSADANDVVDFTAVTTGGNLSPRIRLYSPTGVLLSDQANRYGDGVCSGGSVIELNTVALAVSGTYTVLVGDCSDTNTGTYGIYSQRINNPAGPITMLLGQKQSSSIGSVAYDDTYTFRGVIGDSLSLTASTIGGTMSPRIRLYNPTGALLNDQANRYGDGVCSGGSGVQLNTVTLAASGTYTVLVGDCNDTSTGSYTLTSQCSRANSTGKCTDPSFLPNTKYFHGTETLSWAPPTVATVSVSASLTLSGPVAQILGKNLPPSLSMSWDTTTVPDGNYQLTLTFLDANGNIIASALKQVLINNSVVWHSGTVTTSQTWSSSSVHAIDANLIIPSGVTVTIQPGTIVKVVPGVGITVQSGGILNALGANGEPIIFTSIEDSTVGGDTMLDGGIDNPTSAEWDGVTVLGTGQFNTNSDTEVLYWQAVETGTITANEMWSGLQIHQVNGNITVPSGVTLTIQPGSIVKFSANTGITVQTGGTLIANGTVAQPIYFTSINDDSVGGDTNGDGNATSPAAGDWGSIVISSATASFNHVQMSYGGGPVNSSNVIGMIQSTGSSTVTISNSNITNSFSDGILTGFPNGGDVVSVSSSVIDAVEGRGVNAWPGSTVHVINDTFDNNGVGAFVHGGSVDIANSIITNTKGISGWAAVQVCCGGTLASVSYSDVWANAKGVANYGGTSDPTGTNGNISSDPVYVNEAQGNYRLNYGSPAIDAADGQVAWYSFADIMGDPRYNDSEVAPKAGIVDSNGNYPDMGAYEFVHNAVSNIDFTVNSVTGPTSALSGDQVQVTWTDTNIGTGTAVGPWHDSVYLVRDPDTNPVELFATQVLVGSGVVMGPGASVTNTATIRVPGSTVGNHRWEVKTNTAGDIFEGQNTSNNTGLSLGYVAIDLPQLLVGGAGLSNSFVTVGQSWWYKLIPGPGNTVGANLQLTGNSGSVQLFVGQGYVPTPQQFDIQQQPWNSPSVSAEIPNTSTQTYYVTVYAQTLPSVPAAFTISAVSQQFSLTSVQPSSIVNSGTATVEFIGAELTANATYQIVGANGAAYSASSVYVSDSAHVYATFAATSLASGTYAAQVTENGSTASLKNAITVTTPSAQPVISGQIAYDIQVPSAVRAGYGGVVTIHYQNTGSDDVVAPLMMLATTGATTQFVFPVADLELSPNFATQYTTMVAQGQLLGINQTGGPVGVLPAGAEGSVSLNFTAGTGNNVQFSLYTVSDPTAPIDWAGASSNMQPSWVSAAAWSAIFANFTAAVGNTWGQYNAVLANDATYLGQLGIQEYRINQLQSFELMKAGLDTISRRYYLGAFGQGASHPFDIWGDVQGGGYLFHYPNGSVRAFIPNPGNPGQFIGGIGDYATLSLQSGNQGILLTEKNGTVYHFLPDPNNAVQVRLDYIQDFNGNRITANYTKSLLTSVTSSTGDTLTFTYDVNGRITQVTDPVGRTTTYAYDSADLHLLSITNSSGTISMTYVTGQGAAQQHALQSVTLQDGTHTYYGYDAQGRLINIQKDGGAQQITLAYASTGAITVPDALNNSWQVLPDASGSVAQFVDPLGNLTQMMYDPEEKLIRTIGPDGSTTSLTYDSNGNPTGKTDPLGSQLTTQFAANGDLLGLTDALGDATQFGYDSHYNATSITYPDTRQVKATYDSRGNIASWTNRRGQTISYTWNSNNLLTQKSRSNGTTVNYTYDAHRNLQSVTDSSGTTNLSYDPADHIMQVSYPNGRIVKYTYDSGERRSSLSDQTGYMVTYTYDPVGRLSKVTSGSGGLIASYTYDSNGRLSQKNLGNGAFTTYSYEATGNVLHLINYSSQTVLNSRFDYTYDATGRKITMATLNGQWQYSYDASGQLTSVTPPTTSAVQYAYDAAGNRITTVSGTATTNYDANNLNQYTSVGGFAYSYDADGNLISKQTSSGTWAYTYDDEDRLLTASGPGGSWTYQYDSFGHRISSTNGGTTTQYLVDPTGIGNVEAEFDGTGKLVSHFASGLGLESSAPASGNADFYQFDDSGNTAMVTGADGAVADAYSFLPFGGEIINSVTVLNPFAYVGQFGVTDDGNGLDYMRARYYDPSLGRFVSEDPSGFAGGTNLYIYARNNAISRVDPAGLEPDLLGAITGIGGLSENYRISIPSSVVGFANDIRKQDITNAVLDVGSIALVFFFPESILGEVVAPLLGLPGWYSTLGSFVTGNGSPTNPTQPENPSCLFAGSTCTLPASPSGSPTQTQGTPIARSADPNGKITTGYGNQGYIPPDATITYTIYFENQSSASAAAAGVVVTDALDPNLDASTVQLSQMGFNNVTLNLPGDLQSYSTQASVSTSPYPVTVNTSLNPSTATLTWTMQSIDPVTGAAPADPLAGFLPPENSSQQGDGFVTFTVKPKSGLANGTPISNQASIVFDRNAAIKTNIVTNTIDSVYPSSAVSALPATQTMTTFTVSWSGSDPSGSGIASYDVFSATDGGAYSLWLPATTNTSATFTGSFGHSYSFYTMATDNVGNRQRTPGTAQITVLGSPLSITSASSTMFTVGSAGTFTVTATGSPTVALGEMGALPNGVSFKDNGNGSATLSGTPATATIGTYPITFMASNGFGTNTTQSFSLVVNGIATSVSLTASPTTAVGGAQITLTANVAGGNGASGTPTGTVTFMDTSTTPGTTLLGSANLNGGIAVLSVASLPVGTHNLQAVYTGGSTFLSSSSNILPFVVSAQPQTIVFASPPSPVNYGTAPISLSATASSGLPVAFSVLSGSATVSGNTLTITGAGTVVVAADQAGNNNYSAATEVTYSITVNPKAATIAWGNPSPITYGTSLSSSQLNATASVPGIFVYSPAAGAVLTAGNHTLSATFTPTDMIDYTSASASVSITINPAAPVISWNAPAAVTYGTPLGASQLNATAPVPGTFVYSPAAGTVLTAGSHILAVTFTPTDETDYTSNTASVSISVNPKAATIAWGNLSPITYGTPLGSSQLNATASVPGMFVYSPAAGTVLTAGSHALSVTFTATDTTDYTTSTATVSIIVNQVAPVVSWSAPAAIAYGIPLGSSQPQRYRLCSRHVRLFARSGSGSDGWKPHVVGQLYSDRHNRLHRCHCNGVDFYCASRALHHLEPASGDHLRQRTWVRTVECYFLRSGCFRLHTGGWDSSDCWDPHLVGELHAN